MSKQTFLIVGRGIAGIVLSETLAQRGQHVEIVSDTKANSASIVAAGSMNPIAMKRIIMSWRAAEMMRSSVRFYKDLELRYNTSLLHEIPAERIHASEEEEALWRKRELEFPVADHICAGQANKHVIAPFKTGRIPACYWLNVQALIEAHQEHWSENSAHKTFNYYSKAHKTIIHCTGPFDALPGLVPVQGELLTLRIPNLDMNHSLHRSGFLIPLGNDLYRLGSTFEWKSIWMGPSEKGKALLLEKLTRMIPLPFEIVAHWAGTRPTTKDRRPILGKHPSYEGQYVLNGLGSKGAMLAPWCANHLCDFLLNAAELDQEVDSARFC